MTLLELDQYFNSFLKKENFISDPSMNGIQIQNSFPGQKEIKKVCFAVDACQESAEKAIKEGADLLFVHHGIFWGNCEPITDIMYNRISTFIKNDIALCAYHLPLDANREVGNNYGMAKKIGLTNLSDFGTWHGMTLGVKGEFTIPLSIHEIAERLFDSKQFAKSILAFGKKEIKTVGIISGGGSKDVEQATALGLDAYVTGEFDHAQFHFAKEAGINVIGGGHYATETFGVKLLAEKLKKETGIETSFIDIPTGL